MIGKETWEKLLKMSEGKCMLCGKALRKGDTVIDHILPRRFGGSDRIENLRLICRACNNKTAPHPFSEAAFERYLFAFLSADARFQNVRAGVPLRVSPERKLLLDLTFTRELNGKDVTFAVECKDLRAATRQSVLSAVSQIAYYQKLLPDTRFILAVPTLLAQEYRQLIRAAGITLWDAESLRCGVPDIPLPICAAPDRYDLLADRLRSCPAGQEAWQVYQKLVGEILDALFCPPLDGVAEQNADFNYGNRRDFVLPNYAEHGYWQYLRNRYRAEFIVVDAKNSAKEIGKDDILQVAHYLKEKGPGLFGLIFSRCGASERAEYHLRDVWQNENKMIVIISDTDVEQMLLCRQRGTDPCRVIVEKIQEFRQRI